MVLLPKLQLKAKTFTKLSPNFHQRAKNLHQRAKLSPNFRQTFTRMDIISVGFFFAVPLHCQSGMTQANQMLTIKIFKL